MAFFAPLRPYFRAARVGSRFRRAFSEVQVSQERLNEFLQAEAGKIWEDPAGLLDLLKDLK